MNLDPNVSCTPKGSIIYPFPIAPLNTIPCSTAAEGDLGKKIPKFVGAAPALLGFDEGIDVYCQERAPDWAKWRGHATRCVAANVNILSLYGNRVPYNICRNLEWQTCAAKGMLPGQGTPAIRFATAPSSLDPAGATGKPLGQCKGWVPSTPPTGGVYGFATDDIFFLEVCLFNELCYNGHELVSRAPPRTYTRQCSDTPDPRVGVRFGLHRPIVRSWHSSHLRRARSSFASSLRRVCESCRGFYCKSQFMIRQGLGNAALRRSRGLNKRERPSLDTNTIPTHPAVLPWLCCLQVTLCTDYCDQSLT